MFINQQYSWTANEEFFNAFFDQMFDGEDEEAMDVFDSFCGK